MMRTSQTYVTVLYSIANKLCYLLKPSFRLSSFFIILIHNYIT